MRSEERQDDGLWERKWKRWMNEEEKRTKFLGSDGGGRREIKY